MNIDIILTKLKNGETRVINGPDGYAISQELIPPSKTMLGAAKIIEQLLKQLESNQQIMNQLHNERNQLITELERIQRSNVQSGETAGQT